MQPQLEDRADVPSSLALEILQGVEIPGVDDERLLADNVGPNP